MRIHLHIIKLSFFRSCSQEGKWLESRPLPCHYGYEECLIHKQAQLNTMHIFDFQVMVVDSWGRT